MHGPSNYQVSQCSIQRVLRVCAVEAMVTIAATRDQLAGLEFCELILYGLKREKTQAYQLADIQFLLRIREQQSEDLRSHRRKQSMQQRLSHRAWLYLDRFKRSRFFCGRMPVIGGGVFFWVGVSVGNPP